MERRLLAIVGPTAAGKTEVAVLVAEALGGEVVSADSMQVYRGMDIGAAKPTQTQRARVPHHLIDIIDPDEPFSVADYRARVDAALADIWGRGRQPILAGGSGLYVRAVVDEMDFRAPPDPNLRQLLQTEAARMGAAALHRRLAAVDPEAAARLHPNDLKRIVRALEVASGERARPAATVDRRRAMRYNTAQFGLTLAREELYRRIEARAEAMVAEGLVEEVRRLREQGFDERLISMKGLGYAQIAAYLQGAITLEEAIRLLKRDTRRFAKRQLTWFRADPRIRWIGVRETGGPAGVAELIVREWCSE